MGFQSVPNLVPYIKLSLYCHRSVLVDQIPLQLDREGIKEREDGEGGAIIRGRRLFQIFPSKGGNYSRDGYYSRKYTSHVSQQTTNNYHPSSNRL